MPSSLISQRQSILTALLNKNYIVIPLINGTKRPIIKWKRYKNERPPRTTVEHWFRLWPNADIGVLTGKLSGIMCLDFDAPPYLHSDAYTPTPSGGRHYWYPYTEGDQHGLSVRPGLDIPHLVKIYGIPQINEHPIPIQAASKPQTTPTDLTLSHPGNIEFRFFTACDFINFYNAEKHKPDWDGRYPLARAYASNTIHSPDADRSLGPNYRHTETIYRSLTKPITCKQIVASGFQCPHFNAPTGRCSKNFKVRSPYGLANEEKKWHVSTPLKNS